MAFSTASRKQKCVSLEVLCLVAAVGFGAQAETKPKVKSQPVLLPRYIRHELHGPNGADLIPLALNDRGQVAGKYVNAAGQTHAFLWDKGLCTALYRLLHGQHPEEHKEIIALLKSAGATE